MSKNQELREYFKNKKMPDHYPKWLNSELGEWGKFHAEEDVQLS